MADRAMRPFWIHQFTEYVVGIALIVFGFQDPSPLVPAAIGVLVLVNAACVRGPLGAFTFVGRRLHRWLDLVVLAAIVLAALQPWTEASVPSRAILLVVVAPLGFSWFYTDRDERPQRRARRREAASASSEDVGRSAGRMAANAWLAGKRAVKKHTD